MSNKCCRMGVKQVSMGVKLVSTRCQTDVNRCQRLSTGVKEVNTELSIELHLRLFVLL